MDALVLKIAEHSRLSVLAFATCTIPNVFNKNQKKVLHCPKNYLDFFTYDENILFLYIDNRIGFSRRL